MSGLELPLLVLFVAQISVGLPLLVPYKAVHGPSISILRLFSRGAGLYIGGTILATLAVLFAFSVWEYLSLDETKTETDHKAMMLSVQTARAQLVSVLCAVNICLSLTLVRLAEEVLSHHRLRKSHEALQRQAAGLSQEYSRATAPQQSAGAGADATTAAKQLDALVQAKAALEEDVQRAQADKQSAEKALHDVKVQAKNLEQSYDALMKENMTLRAGDEKVTSSWAFASHKKAD